MLYLQQYSVRFLNKTFAPVLDFCKYIIYLVLNMTKNHCGARILQYLEIFQI